jgi:hypothetical protein
MDILIGGAAVVLLLLTAPFWLGLLGRALGLLAVVVPAVAVFGGAAYIFGFEGFSAILALAVCVALIFGIGEHMPHVKWTLPPHLRPDLSNVRFAWIGLADVAVIGTVGAVAVGLIAAGLRAGE